MEAAEAQVAAARRSPVAVVFGTYELLEAIVYELPIRDVLLAQRVDRQFKAVITDSTKLQQALFFKPIPGGPIEAETSHCSSYRVYYNPLLRKLVHQMCMYSSEGYVNSKGLEVALLGGRFIQGRPLHRSWSAPDASWRRMLHSQPPIRNYFYLMIVDHHTDHECHTEKHDLTMEAVIQELG